MSDSDTVSQPSPPTSSITRERPFCRHFFAPCNAVERKIYLKALVGGCFLIILAIFAVFPIYWGALWKTPERALNGWVIDFDGGMVGQVVAGHLASASSATKVALTAVPSVNFPGGPNDLANAVVEQHTWVAVAINPGTSERLQASYLNPNTTYNGAGAITMYAAEARNENA
ncbi:hypothetical protein H0H87_008394 [Tephrocybe sp. NHM501043]|nr:hypothetical protein H0H87_008394 [Tephrocybe sp. NHM501043]